MVAPPVPPHIAGDEKVDRDWLIAHLGRGPFFTWQRLLWCRNPSGITWATRAGIARHISLYVKSTGETRAYSERAVEEHLGKLRAVFLIKDLRPDFEVVDDKMVRRLYRLVYGSIVKPKELFTIPNIAKAAMLTRGALLDGEGRGGKRAGAGRKPKNQVPVMNGNQKPVMKNQKPVMPQTPNHHRFLISDSDLKDEIQAFSESKTGDEKSKTGDEINQKPVPSINLKDITSGTHSLFFFASQKKNGGAGGPPSLSKSKTKDETGGGEGGTTQIPNSAAPTSVPPSSSPKKETAPGEQKPHAFRFSQPDPSIPPASRPSSPISEPGASGGLQAAFEKMRVGQAWNRKQVAPFFGECGVPKIPHGLNYHHPPPPLAIKRYEKDIDEGVKFLERWYNAALSSRYPKAFPVRAPKVKGLRQYWELAVSTLIEHNIPPGSWVAFSIDEWRVTVPHRALKAPPDVKFVFGQRMQTRLWAYRSMLGEYEPSRVLTTNEAQDVLSRLYSVKAFAAIVGRDEAKIRDELTRQFPLGFEREVLKARNTTHVTEEALKQHLKAGRWVWSRDFDGKKARALAVRRPSLREGENG